MDIHLQTHTDDPALALLHVRRFSDGSGCVAQLRVRSRGFIVDRPFFFDVTGLGTFVSALTTMDQTLVGTAELRTEYEYDFIRLAVSRTGRVIVSGEVHEYSEWSQLLHFAFATDQTVLGAFARDLEAILNLDAI